MYACALACVSNSTEYRTVLVFCERHGKINQCFMRVSNGALGNKPTFVSASNRMQNSRNAYTALHSSDNFTQTYRPGNLSAWGQVLLHDIRTVVPKFSTRT